MKIKLSKTQWELIGKKAGWDGWKKDPKDSHVLNFVSDNGDNGDQSNDETVVQSYVDASIAKMKEIGATQQQIDSAIKTVRRYKEMPINIFTEMGGWGAKMLQFKFITIGIEKDGHAHS